MKCDPTLEDICRTQLTLEDDIYTVEILKTLPSEAYRAMREHLMKIADGMVIIYSITSKESFNSAQRIWDNLQKVERHLQRKGVPVVLVGNKADLEGQRDVSKDEGKQLADRLGCEFEECSAKAGPGDFERIVKRLVVRIRDQKQTERLQAERRKKAEEKAAVDAAVAAAKAEKRKNSFWRRSIDRVTNKMV